MKNNKKIEDDRLEDILTTSEKGRDEKEVKEEKKIENTEKASEETKEVKEKKDPKKTYILLGISGAIFLVSFVFYFIYVINAYKIPVKKVSYNKEASVVKETIDVDIFYSSESMNSFNKETIKIPKDNFSNQNLAIFENLKKYNNIVLKENKDKKTVLFDQSIELLNSYLVDGKLFLNISGNIKDSITSKRQEHTLIYLLVDTFGNLPEIQSVKILINNQDPDSLKWYSLKVPLKPNRH